VSAPIHPFFPSVLEGQCQKIFTSGFNHQTTVIFSRLWWTFQIVFNFVSKSSDVFKSYVWFLVKRSKLNFSRDCLSRFRWAIGDNDDLFQPIAYSEKWDGGVAICGPSHLIKLRNCDSGSTDVQLRNCEEKKLCVPTYSQLFGDFYEADMLLFFLRSFVFFGITEYRLAKYLFKLNFRFLFIWFFSWKWTERTKFAAPPAPLACSP
jgi:hypothetical protein